MLRQLSPRRGRADEGSPSTRMWSCRGSSSAVYRDESWASFENDARERVFILALYCDPIYLDRLNRRGLIT